MIILFRINPIITDKESKLVFYEEDKEKAYLSFKQDGYTLEILELFVYSDEKYIYECLIKALGQFGFNHSCFYIYNKNKDFYDILNDLGFVYENDKQVMTINKLFNHSCNGGNIE